MPAVILNVELKSFPPDVDDVSDMLPPTVKLVTDDASVVVYELPSVVLETTAILPMVNVPAPESVPV